MSALHRCFLVSGILVGASIASGSAFAECAYSSRMNKGARISVSYTHLTLPTKA